MSLKPYTNIEHNEIEGPMGYGPDHWTVTKVKQLAKEGYKSFTDGDWIESPYITDDGIRLIQTGNIGIGSYKEQGFRYIAEDTFKLLRCTEVLPGDVLICRLAAPVGRACIAPDNLADRMITSVDVCILKTRSDVDRRFVVYLMSSAGYLDYVDMIARGSTRQRISRTQLGNIKVLVPTHNEQRAIANYLDQRAVAIDDLIDKKQRLIELLQEKRQALITQAVTKGLNPSVPMKDSGIEWLGEIPVHWETVFVKQVYEVQLGKMLQTQSEDEQDVLVNYLKALQVQWDSVDTSDLPQMWASPHDIDKYAVYQGDLVVCEGGEVGRAAIINGLEIPCIIQNALHRVRSSHHSLNRYLMYLLRVAHYNGWFDVLCNKATIAHLTGEKLGAMKIPLPPISEQVAIINFLESKTRLIDTLALKLERSIQNLNEFRQTLISAAVTGKIDVREEAEACL